MNLRQVMLSKGKCPLDFLAEQGNETENAWIFFSKTIVEALKNTADSSMLDGRILMLSWDDTDERPGEGVQMRPRNVNGRTKWFEVVGIKAEDIAFTKPAIDPAAIFFIDTWK